MVYSKTTAFLSMLSQGDKITFKYSGGSWPGVPRTLFFHSWYISGPVRGAYMTAYDSDKNFKTFHCSKISELSLTSQSNSVKEEVSENNFSNWTSWIKKNNIIQFTYSDEDNIRNVTFVEFTNRTCSAKRKILTYENGYTKMFFIDKMKVHKIFEVEEQYNSENCVSSPQEYDTEDSVYSPQENDSEDSLSSSEYDSEESVSSPQEYDSEESVSSPQKIHNEIKHLESKQKLLGKEMKAHIDSQNTTIKKLETKYAYLQNECYKLEDELQYLYSIMNTHKALYPTTWENDFQPKKPDGWEVINSPSSKK